MIRIPTGPVPAKTARTISTLLGITAALLHYFKPELLPALTGVAQWLLPLGITLGQAPAVPVKVPT